MDVLDVPETLWLISLKTNHSNFQNYKLLFLTVIDTAFPPYDLYLHCLQVHSFLHIHYVKILI